jgi:hypothetical protein
MRMSVAPSRAVFAVLLFKLPVFLSHTLAFPVVASWAPCVQFVTLILLYASAGHATITYGKKLMANPYLIGTCRAADDVFSWPMSLLGLGTQWGTHGDGGDALHCEYYLLGMWFLCLSVVFWQSLFWQIKIEQRERRQYLQSLGLNGTMAWPELKVMVMQLVALQLYLTLLFMLSLEDFSLLPFG